MCKIFSSEISPQRKICALSKYAAPNQLENMLCIGWKAIYVLPGRFIIKVEKNNPV